MSKNAGISSRHKQPSSSAEPSAPATTARALAERVLERVWIDQAYAALTLDAELRRAALDPRDAALATELVYGVLRTQGVLEAAIAVHAKNDRWRKNVKLRAPLLMAAYTMRFLDRVPPFAAVSEAVESAKRSSGPKVAGFANAVLRKLATQAERDGTRPQVEAVLEATPTWLRTALETSLGQGAHVAYLTSTAARPPTSLCLAAGQDPAAWLERMAEAAPRAELSLGKLSPRCLLVRRAGDLRQLPGCGSDWIVQEEGAQGVALLSGAQPGEQVLDACAGRGSKAFLLSDLVGAEGEVDAADLHPRKLELLRESGTRGERVRDIYAIDWTRGSGDLTRTYDRVLVDAPCSGVGTLRRRPEIGTRLTRKDVARLAELQQRVARGAARHVRDGGWLIYAICSVLRQEAEDVVRALTEPQPGEPRLSPCALEGTLADRIAGGASSLRLLPQEHGTDGYFVAAFRVER